MSEQNAAAHIVLLPCPGMGHLIPFAQLAKQLVLRHNLTVTFITFSDFSSDLQLSLISSLPPGISISTLPHAPLDDLPPDAHLLTRLCHIIARNVPSLRSILQSLKQTTPIVACVIDMFGTDALSVIKDLGILPYIFSTVGCQSTSLMLHLPSICDQYSCEFRDIPSPVILPGCLPLNGEDLFEPLQDRKNEAFSWNIHHARRYGLVEGILINSFDAMESSPAEQLREGKPAAWNVGPLVWSERGGVLAGEKHECVEWLDGQPAESVLYVSFGSGGALSREQTKELALGLQMSGVRFLWAMREPAEEDASAGFFKPERGGVAEEFVPESSTKENGKVVSGWAPQMEVLGHEATGGFLSHCGWNSTLESVLSGVPMIAWPLFAEQRMNARMLVEGVKVAVRVVPGREDGVVGREEVARAVRELIEGEEGRVARARVRKLREEARRAVDTGGPSDAALTEVVKRWRNGAANGSFSDLK